MAKKDTAGLNSPAPDLTAESQAPEPSTASTESAASPKDNPKAGGPPSGFYIYIGPSLKGLIRNGDIYRGDRAHALEKVREAVERYPLVKTLIIPGDYLPAARLKVKTPGNALYANYVKLAGQAKDGRKKEEANG